jgi:integrase
MVQQFLVSKQNYSKSIISILKITLNQIFDTAIANRLIDYSPMVAVKVKSKQTPKPKETFTYEEIEQIKEQAKTHRYGWYVLILLYAGLRASELCGLKWEDIDLEKGTLSVKRASTNLVGMVVIDKPKNANSLRTIPIPKELIEILKNHRSNGYVVVNTKGKPQNSMYFTSYKYDVFFKETGIRRLSPHKMRHTCGTLLYEKCHDIFAVQKYLGHSNAVVTSKTYVHENAEDLRKQLFDE